MAEGTLGRIMDHEGLQLNPEITICRAIISKAELRGSCRSWEDFTVVPGLLPTNKDVWFHETGFCCSSPLKGWHIYGCILIGINVPSI
jgi:hypothetical protein